MKEQDVILYNDKEYQIIRIDQAGYCDIQQIAPPHQVELTHIKHIKDCPTISRT
ncbi:hypothetical protein [Bacillus sp. FJAT-42315]|uniref:hypothetical protein n=1 Tax=Bacillus sp. FJAT-42315 TaxID=2014077 RepID=UPI0012FED05D|nr:hypothetical protein [Bacillus sp. FJAT-42315]